MVHLNLFIYTNVCKAHLYVAYISYLKGTMKLSHCFLTKTALWIAALISLS